MPALCKPHTLQHSFLDSLYLYLDVFGPIAAYSWQPCLQPACMLIKVECLTSHQPFVKHLISVDLICSLVVSEPSLATARVF